MLQPRSPRLRPHPRARPPPPQRTHHRALAKALQALKLPVSKQTDTKPFWQPRYYDFNVFTGRKRLEKLHYMHANPVTRGLSTTPKTGPTPALITTSQARFTLSSI